MAIICSRITAQDVDAERAVPRNDRRVDLCVKSCKCVGMRRKLSSNAAIMNLNRRQ